MAEQTYITNELNGSSSEGPTILAGLVKGGITLNSANQAMHRGRSLSMATNLFRLSISLLGCTAAYGVAERIRPLTAATDLCALLGIPTDWLTAVGHWFSRHADMLSVTGCVLTVLGFLALPRPQSLHGDLGNIVEWRSPFTALLGLVLIMQCGASPWDLITSGACLTSALWLVGRGAAPGTRADRLAVAFTGITLAILYLPFIASAWLLSRDVDRGS